MGASDAAQIEKEMPLVRDPEIVRYINVLGDSLAGVTDDRSLTCILTNVCSSTATGNLIQLAAGGVFAKFSRDDESEADAEGVKTVIRAGIDPAGIPQMFGILLDERKARPAGVDAFFLSHPLEENRIAATQSLIAQQPRDALRGLAQDSPNFQAFKKRLAALPPSPPTKKTGN